MAPILQHPRKRPVDTEIGINPNQRSMIAGTTPGADFPGPSGNCHRSFSFTVGQPYIRNPRSSLTAERNMRMTEEEGKLQSLVISNTRGKKRLAQCLLRRMMEVKLFLAGNFGLFSFKYFHCRHCFYMVGMALIPEAVQTNFQKLQPNPHAFPAIESPCMVFSRGRSCRKSREFISQTDTCFQWKLVDIARRPCILCGFY